MIVFVGRQQARLRSSPPPTAATFLVDSPVLPPGWADVMVQLGSGPVSRLKDAVRAALDPTITALTPLAGRPGDDVTITGSSFVGTPTVDLLAGTAVAQATINAHISDTELHIRVPPAPAGASVASLRITLES